MNRLFGTALSLSLALVGLRSSAQNNRVPFKQIEGEALFSASAVVPGAESSVSRSYEAYPPPVVAASVVYAPPTYKPRRILDAKYLLVNGLHLGLAGLDLGLTRHCMANHHCREGNPLMPSSFAGQLAVESAFVSSGAFISFRLKKQDSKLWWLSPVVGISAHTAGAVTGFINR